MRAPMLIPLLLCSSACAGVGMTERAYERDILPDLALRSLDVVVVAKGPPISTGTALDISPFEVPQRTTVLPSDVSAQKTEAALVATLARDLQSAGFEVRMIHAAGGDREASPPAPLPVVETSTTVLSSTTSEVRIAQPRAAPEPVDEGPPSAPLPSGTRLQDLLDASKADGVLVVRVVVVDEFHLHEPSEPSPQLDEAGQVIARTPGKSYPVRGRLLIGQAFLFDRKTGLRLWSRQLPNMPDGGKILKGHPILRFGFVQPDKTALEENVKAERAADRFVDAMFAEFPRAQEGTPAARVALDAVDVEAEIREQSFFDESRVLLDVEIGWAAEGSGSELKLDDEPLPSVGTGAVSPYGIGRVGARLGYMTTSAWIFSVGAQFGFAPGSFNRSYHRDTRDLGIGGLDRSAAVTIDGANTYLAEVSLGRGFLLADSLLLVPALDLFIDVWSVDAAPEVVVPDRSHLRIGGGIDLDLLYQVSSLVYGKIGIGGRGGYDTAGPAFGGINVAVGIGLFL